MEIGDPMESRARAVREWFSDASSGFRSTLALVGPDDLDRPGLGDWDVRSLIGHTCRSYLTVESYLIPADDVRAHAQVAVASPAEYMRRALGGITDAAAITERGRAAGVALGADPIAEALQISDRVTELVHRTPDDANVDCLVGVMTFVDYLATRAFELTVHGLDLTRALGVQPPGGLARSAVRAIEIAIRVGDDAQAVQALMALTGRTSLPPGFSML